MRASVKSSRRLDGPGRGLQIVSVLADRWGSRATGRGTSVWFSVALAEG